MLCNRRLVKAVAVSRLIDSLCSGITYMGGIPDLVFALAWAGVDRPESEITGDLGRVETSIEAGDPSCLEAYSQHEVSPDVFEPDLTLLSDNPIRRAELAGLLRGPGAGSVQGPRPAEARSRRLDQRRPRRRHLRRYQHHRPLPDTSWSRYYLNASGGLSASPGPAGSRSYLSAGNGPDDFVGPTESGVDGPDGQVYAKLVGPLLSSPGPGELTYTSAPFAKETALVVQIAETATGNGLP